MVQPVMQSHEASPHLTDYDLASAKDCIHLMMRSSQWLASKQSMIEANHAGG